jgi:hypothetical protein
MQENQSHPHAEESPESDTASTTDLSYEEVPRSSPETHQDAQAHDSFVVLFVELLLLQIIMLLKNLKPMSLDKDLQWTMGISSQLWNEIRISQIQISQMLPLLDKEASLGKPNPLKPWTLFTCRVTTSVISSIFVLCRLNYVVAILSSACQEKAHKKRLGTAMLVSPDWGLPRGYCPHGDATEKRFTQEEYACVLAIEQEEMEEIGGEMEEADVKMRI